MNESRLWECVMNLRLHFMGSMTDKDMAAQIESGMYDIWDRNNVRQIPWDTYHCGQLPYEDLHATLAAISWTSRVLRC